MRQHNFVHITKHEIQVRLFECVVTPVIFLQDSTTVLLILKHVLQELKHVGILRVHLRSDNAGELPKTMSDKHFSKGCYHSTRTLTSLPAISKKVGVEILSFTFSEAQGGKGRIT